MPRGGRNQKPKSSAPLVQPPLLEERLRELLNAGVDVIRLNFSHGTQADHQHVIERVHQLATQLKLPVRSFRIWRPESPYRHFQQ